MLHPNRNIAFSTYPFGSHVAALVMARLPRHIMAERGKSFGDGYKFGFNNQEKDSELGDAYAFEYRIHDARLGRFLSVDPLAPEYPWNSTYAFAENRVIDGIDLEGLEYVRADGKQTNNPEITEPVFSTGLTEMTGGVMMYIPEGRLIAYVEKSSGHIIKSFYDKSGNFHHYGSVGKKVNSQSNTNGTGEAIKQETSSSNLGVVKDIQPMGIKTSEAEAANFPVTNPIDLSRLRNQNKSGMEKFLAGSIAGYQQGFGIDTKHGAIDRYQYCWGGGNINAQSSGGWVGPANTINGGIGVLAGAVENLSGGSSIGTNGKIYSSGWGGNQYVSTAKVAKVGKILGYGTLALGTAFDGHGVYNYYTKGANSPNAVHPGKAGLNLGVGVWGLMNPATATGAALYYGIDAFYPGGFNGAMQNNGSLIQQNQAILGSGWNLYRDH